MPRSLPPLLVALLVIYSLHQMLISVIAPLSVELGLTPAQLGLVFTVASVTIALSSPLWGLLLDATGPRPVLFAGLGLCVAGPAGFAVAVAFGIDETLTPDLAFVMVLLFRSFLFSLGLAALSVAALAVAGTSTHHERTTAIGLVGAMQGLASAIGPMAGGALALASLQVPLYLSPVIAVALALGVLIFFKPAEGPRDVVPSRPWELVPAFVAGFLMYLSFVLVQTVAVFLTADGERVEAGALDATLMASAIGLAVAQGMIVPLQKWPAVRLMRIGAPMALAGYAVIAVAPSQINSVFAVVAAGVGFAVTGFAARASLGVGTARQGLIAGLVTATGGMTFVVGPMLSALLYDMAPIAPVIAAGAAAAVATGVSLLPTISRGSMTVSGAN
ncbi:Na+/melibiose symporter [Lentzea waywayandensis]|uniref:Na+/melibiose symporter n=1 Tax=Lentzea waywayandensis TaxID=84724 RepID=A0A1I6FI31_9PSEU|nr:MFS transporter [Lentzea waywayandensis]SFR29603.1 Na+/melibiose symporter [Lentzea waywayandensis]